MTCRVRRLCKAAAVAGLLVLAAVLPSAGLAQEAGDPETAVDALSAENAAVPSVGPSLTCTGRGLPIMAPVVQVHGMALTCTVASAAPGDTSFTLRAVLGGPGGAGRTIDPLCTGSPAKGTGTCRVSVIDRSDVWRGGLVISGTLSPSGGPLGPFAVGQAMQGASAAS